SAWDQALELSQTHGLRHTQVTSLFASPALTLFMESESDGIAPMRSLAIMESEEGRRALHPSASEALTRLGYDAKKIQAVSRYVAGAMTLLKA
ncbi:hypothetical protein, partial [Streptomyces europaeiscabiei]|uniref:hypothetical protein n=1 Tax=Streptomyces europaeiscabiei TaxID=146819 RepID=UPI0038F6AC46